jgi:hypothetical protein
MAQVDYAPFVFEAPDGWEDRSVAAFVAPSRHNEPIAPNVVVTREPRRPADSLSAHVQRQVLAVATTLPGFEVFDSQQIDVAGRSALRTRCVWRAEDTTVEQTMVHIEPQREDTVVVSVTFTSSADTATSLASLLTRLLSTLGDDRPGR